MPLNNQLQLQPEEKEFLEIKHLDLIIPKIRKVLIGTNSSCLNEVYEDLLNWRDILSRYSEN